MRRFVVLFVLFCALSCAVTPGRNTPPGSGTGPRIPATAGTYTLTFVGHLGEQEVLRSPQGISFGIDGTLYVCDRDNSSIIRFDRSGGVVSQFNGFDSRTARMFLPIDVSVSGGIEIYVLDGANSRVLRFDRNLKNAYVIYTPDTDGNTLFTVLNGLAFDSVSGDLFITDRNNGAIIRIGMLGGNTHSSGRFGSEKASLREPAGLDVAPDGSLFVADMGNGAVGVLRHFGAGITFIGAEALEAPADVAVLPDSLLAVADRNGVVVMNRRGVPEAVAGFGIDRTMSPRSVAYHDGNLYISDTRSAAILVYRLNKRTP